MAGGKRGQACESLEKGTSPAPLCSPACRLSSPSLAHHAHVSTIYTDIFYIRSIYKYIYTHIHIYRVHLQAQKPSACPVVGGQEESWSYFWAALPGAGRKLTTGQEEGPVGGRVGVTQFAPTAQCPAFLPHPQPHPQNKRIPGLPGVVSGAHL